MKTENSSNKMLPSVNIEPMEPLIPGPALSFMR